VPLFKRETGKLADKDAAEPEVFWLPAVLTPGRSMFAEPLKLTPPIVRAVCSVVAVVALPLNAALTVPALKLPEASRATMVLPVLVFVALEVTVKVAALDWLAVNVCEPDKPTPDTLIVKVPLFTFAAVVAVLALPFRLAVIVPAEKLPEASRATIAFAVFALVAVVLELGMEIVVFVTLVTCPCALVTKTGTVDAEPYVPAVPVLVMLNWVPVRVNPVPAE
jgi:hypothetical protein